MDELETRLRSALTDMAAEVPPSHHPWAEQERRLAARARRSRRPVLMAVVAAAVVALVAVPVVFFNVRGGMVQSADTPTEPHPTSIAPPPSAVTSLGRLSYKPEAGETVLTEPVSVSSVPSGTGYRALYAFATSRAGQDKLLLCMMEGDNGANELDGTSKTKNCQPLPPPRPGKYVWQRYTIPATEGPGQFVYVASHPTANILVRLPSGYRLASKVSEGRDFGLFMAYAGVPGEQPLAYTARDKANVTLENG